MPVIMGFDACLDADPCATTDRIGPDGPDHGPETVPTLAVASMHNAFGMARPRDALRV